MAKKKSPLSILFLTLFIDLIGFSIIFPLFPDMLTHYLSTEESGGILDRLINFLESLSGGTDEAMRGHFTAVLFGGFLGSLYSALQFIFSPIWGSLSDRLGRKPILLFSIAGIAISYLIWIFSGSFMLLILSRLLGGCMSGNISTASAAVADSTSRENRAKGMGIIGAAFGLGFIGGPALGGIAYYLVGGENSVVHLLGKYPELADFGINPFSGAALVAFVLASINFLWVWSRFDESISAEQKEQDRNRPRPFHPLLSLRKFDLPGVNRANLSYFLFLVAFSGVEFTLTFFTREAFNYSAGNMAALFVFAGLIIALIQGGVIRRVAPIYGEKKVTIIGLILLLPGFFLICFSPPSQVLLYTGLGFMAVGSALSIPCLTSLVSLYTPMDRQGTVLGVFRSLGALSRAVGPIIFCGVYWKFGAIWPYISGAVLLLIPIFLALKLPRPVKEEEGIKTTS